MSVLPMIKNLISSIEKETNALPQNKPLTMVSVLLPAPTAKNPTATEQKNIFVLGKVAEVKEAVSKWLNGNADLSGFVSRYSTEEIVFSHRLGHEATASVF